MTKEELREKLASLEHEQWAHCFRYTIENLTPENIERWSKQEHAAYEDLTEEDKDKDREWADKVMIVITELLDKLALEKKENPNSDNPEEVSRYDGWNEAVDNLNSKLKALKA